MRKNLLFFPFVLFLFSCAHQTMPSEFTVELDGNPTTGYEWNYVPESKELTLLERTYTPKAANGMVGVGGTYRFRFRATKPINREILFHYERRWEGRAAQEKRVRVIVEN